MANSEALKKARKKYSEKVKRITIDFTPAEHDLYDFVMQQENKRQFLKNLIREYKKGHC